MTKGTVSGVIANMVTLSVDGPVSQGEICYIETGGDRLMAEVIKVVGTDVYVQVFESTRGLKVGAQADFTGRMLEVKLAPGMLSKNYDGLQNDLDKMDGVFLKRGQYTNPLDEDRIWDFTPIAKVGDEVIIWDNEKITVEDIATTTKLFDDLMGEAITPRKNYIKEHSKEATGNV